MKKGKLTIWDWAKYPKAKVQAYGENISYEVYFADLKNEKLYLRTDPFDSGDNRDDVSIEDCKLELRSIEELTEKERYTIGKMLYVDYGYDNEKFYNYESERFILSLLEGRIWADNSVNTILLILNYLRSIGIDVDGFIENGKAVKK